ncbi:MAG: hypothetical protein SF182_27535 [Deltaproteobacteria bacterium]|nr:hypothetical protein [Deltaproteobacteria bacterium]
MRRVTRGAAVALALAAISWSTPAWAPFHLVVIEEVFFGTQDCPDAQYVRLRTLSLGQVLVFNQTVDTQTADGSSAPPFGKFARNLSNGASGVAMIIGTSQAQELFGMDMDQVADGRLVIGDGRVCFGSFGGQPVDCLAYGAYTGDNGSRGQPAVRPATGQALVRVNDTGNNVMDFQSGAPAPVNNKGESGTLGVCAPPATLTPTATAVPDSGCYGDCNGDGEVTINELITLVNIALGSSPVSACAALPPNAEVTISDLVRAVNNALSGCPATPTPTATLAVPTGTATATVTPSVTPGGPLGVRRFSLNPSTSQVIATLASGFAFPTSGMEGFLELRAGVPNTLSGLAVIDVTDTSEYLAIDLPMGGQALCIKPARAQLPFLAAGFVACGGGIPLGLDLTIDHNLGTVGLCSGGAQNGESCASDDDCPDGNCFSGEDCTAAGGHLEDASDPFPGVCNGSLVGMGGSEDSGVGAVLISPDPVNGFIHGLPAAIITEAATPCGDEPNAPGYSTVMAFTSGRAVGRILDYNNLADQTLEAEYIGQNFSCPGWTTENGPGTLAVAAPSLNLSIGPAGVADLISTIVLDD